MKRSLCFILLICLLCITAFSGCSFGKKENANNKNQVETVNSKKFGSISDKDLPAYLDEKVYDGVIDNLNSDEYFVENVQTVYISQEYIDELEANSKSNIYFGYELNNLDKDFDGGKYVFTCSEDGKTTVESYKVFDDTYEKMIKNVAIGTGVVLVCVTISAVAPEEAAVAAIFAVAAEKAVDGAIVGASISAATSAVVTSYQTKDPEKTLKAAGLGATEGFEMGAITGAVTGGFSKTFELAKCARNGLSLDEVAAIQKESKYSSDIIKQFHNMDEYNVYKDAGLYTKNINGNNALIRNIDLNYESIAEDGTKMTNLELMKKGNAPIEPATGRPYELHHIGQKADGSLAVLTNAEHHKNASILNIAGKSSEINRGAFDSFRKQFWKEYVKQFV